MPKVVDHDARRRALAEAVVQIAGRRGLAAATLRAVAQQSGMSMGSVQHYFGDREQMLDFVLAYVQERRAARIAEAIGREPTAGPHQMLSAIVSEVLAENDDNVLFERVRTMFVDRAMHHPGTARVLGEGAEQVTHLLHGLVAQLTVAGVDPRGRIDARSTAELLWLLLDGLPATVALGQRSAAEARALASTFLHAAGVEGVPTGPTQAGAAHPAAIGAAGPGGARGSAASTPPTPRRR